MNQDLGIQTQSGYQEQHISGFSFQKFYPMMNQIQMVNQLNPQLQQFLQGLRDDMKSFMENLKTNLKNEISTIIQQSVNQCLRFGSEEIQKEDEDENEEDQNQINHYKNQLTIKNLLKDLYEQIQYNLEISVKCEQILMEVKEDYISHENIDHQKFFNQFGMEFVKLSKEIYMIDENLQKRMIQSSSFINRQLLDLQKKTSFITYPRNEQDITFKLEESSIAIKEEIKQQLNIQHPIEATKENYNQFNLVYVTKTGKKYHVKTCKFAKNGEPIPINEAISQGISSCAQCIGD